MIVWTNNILDVILKFISAHIFDSALSFVVQTSVVKEKFEVMQSNSSSHFNKDKKVNMKNSPRKKKEKTSFSKWPFSPPQNASL